MVKGIEVFKRHFASSTHQFVLIGGAACDLLHEEAGLQFRATNDLDIVLCIETLDVSFVKRFRDVDNPAPLRYLSPALSGKR